MLEFLGILGLVLVGTGFISSVFIFIKCKIPKAIAYFTGSENKRIKEYQKRQKEYINSSKAPQNLKSTGNNIVGQETEPLNADDDSFAAALLYAESTTMLLDDSETEILE